MGRLQAVLSLGAKLPTVARTLSHIRPAQARAQLAHMLFGAARPARRATEALRLAVPSPSTDFLSPPAHVEVEPQGSGARLELLARSIDVVPGGIDWAKPAHGPLFAYHVHEQNWLRHPRLSAALRQTFLLDWIARHDAGVGWEPHPISLRLLSWGKLLLTSEALPPEGPSGLRHAMLASMGDQAETLAGTLETRLQANHLLSNLIGVVFAGLLLEGEGADHWRGLSGRLVEELERQVGPEGAHEERSPMYHALLLENLLDLINLAKVSPRTPSGLKSALCSRAAQMLDALAFWTLPDGKAALFADTAWGVSAETPALIDYARRLGLIDQAPDVARLAVHIGGYARLGRGPFTLLASVSGPSPSHQPGHAHCDVGSFELCVEGRRLVADTGVYEYVPGERREQARSTRSHAALIFDGHEQSELWAAHRVGGRIRTGPCEVGTDFFTLEMRGWQRKAPAHVRSVFVREDEVMWVDVVRASGHAVESRIPLSPGWQISLEGALARVVHEKGDLALLFELPESLDWQVESAPFFPGFHQVVERSVLVGRGRTPVELRTRLRLQD